MKALRMTGLTLVFVLLLTLSVFVAWRAWDQAHTLYPTPETESAFLKNYNPQHCNRAIPVQ
jgi:predicted negative regulator of RcsB-dependent stress response